MRGPATRAFVVTLLLGVAARAQTAPADTGFRMQVTNCPDEIAARLPALVKLEIDVLLRERGPARSPPESIGVRCQEDRAHIDVSIGGSSQSSSIDLRVLAAEHRARAVALAAAELVHSMSNRAPPPQPPASQAAAPPTPEPPDRVVQPSAVPHSSPRPTLLLGALVELLGKPAAPLLGARLQYQHPVSNLVVPTLSFDGAFGNVRAGSADVKVKTASAAAHLYLGASSGRLRWELGPGARIGFAHLAGHPVEPGLEGHTLGAIWAGPEMRARLAFAPLDSAAFALELGAGYVALPVHGMLDGSQPVYAVQGPWGSVCAAVGLGL